MPHEDISAPTPYETGNAAGDVISGTFRQNQEFLQGRAIRDALYNDGMVLREYEGVRCYLRPMVLYVRKDTGRIDGVGSLEKINRETALHEEGTDEAIIEESATGLPVEFLKDSSVSKVYAWFEEALLTGKSENGEVNILRPASWPRNSRIRLSEQAQRLKPLEELIPDPIERGVFEKSIELYNSTPQSTLFTPPTS